MAQRVSGTATGGAPAAVGRAAPGTRRIVPLLFDLIDAARTLELEPFERAAMRALGGVVGFDGAVWGTGVVDPSASPRFRISRACLVDRPLSLLEEYAPLADRDPVTARFLACPERPIRASARQYDQTRRGAEIGAYLRRHHIAELLLVSTASVRSTPQPHTRRWLTAYRETAHPFGAGDLARLNDLLPLWTQAHALCLARRMERLARNAPEGAAVALCDAAGSIHAAEPGFTERTGLAEGDLFDRRAKPGVGLVEVPRREGSWQLLLARPQPEAGGLTGRERQVAREYVRGLSHKEIARELGSAPATIRTQLQSVYRKLGVHTRIGLLRRLERQGEALLAAEGEER
jgi:DNA-binding CsgD family transcriptional regulator